MRALYTCVNVSTLYLKITNHGFYSSELSIDHHQHVAK